MRLQADNVSRQQLGAGQRDSKTSSTRIFLPIVTVQMLCNQAPSIALVVETNLQQRLTIKTQLFNKANLLPDQVELMHLEETLVQITIVGKARRSNS